jgi:acylphosphatase
MAKHLRISGRVQGVGFRYSMQHEARRLGVTGWVRNCRDGSVEAVVGGPEEAVEAMLNWARSGPPAARVKGVSVTDTSGEFQQFELRPSM